VLEDATLKAERASADESLLRERKENARVLTGLLPLEREKTDRYLLTERERSDDALANRDDFLAIVSHDLRNLLSGIVMSAELLSKRTERTGEGKGVPQEAERIQRYAARMNRLIGDLLDVASIDNGRLALAPKPGDAVVLIREAIDTFHASAAAKGVSLTADTLEASLPAEYDHDRMLQVLLNLLANAIKFTASDGSIRVHCERAGDALRFSVKDTGAGIPEDMLEAVFERFWQVGKNDRRGLGLGLYIARCIVEAHGGTIRAESAPARGRGSTLSFTLPVQPRAQRL
jgi:signal transduction histidine kinase